MFGILPQIDEPQSDTQRSEPRDARIWVVAVFFLLCDVISSLLNNESNKLASASLVWLPNGILIGALICSSRRRWPALLAVCFAIDATDNFVQGSPVSTSLIFAGFNTLETVVAAGLLYRTMYPHSRLTDWRQMRAFLLYGVVIAPAVAAFAASVYLFVQSGTPFSQSWRFWYAADLLGIATSTPLYLSLHHERLFQGRSRRELAVLFLVLASACALVFGFSAYPSLWMVMLVLLLLGVRGGYTASALGLILVIGVGGYLTILGHGALGVSTGHTLPQRMFYFQSFTAVCMVAMYLTEVAMASNRAAQVAVRRSEASYRSLADELELRVADRTRELQLQIAEREVIQHDLVNAKLLAEGANHAKSAFLANMSHELRTPLNAILGYSEMLEDDAIEEGRTGVAEDLKRIQRAGHHLLSIINDVLDLAKIESGRIDIFPKKTSISTIMQDLVATISPLARENNNRLVIELEHPEAVVELDPVKFKQCLLNLLSNACKFTREGTVTLDVHMSTDAAHPGMLWSVKDNGIGISKADQEKLFRPFTQVDNTFTRRHDGTGLGLAISQRLIRLMDGELLLESEPGKGSTFTLLLPASVLLSPFPLPAAEEFRTPLPSGATA